MADLDTIVRRLRRESRRRVSVPKTYSCDTIVRSIRAANREQQSLANLNMNSVSGHVYINDGSVLNPFGIDARILKTIKEVTKDCIGYEARARKLFDWFEENINYGTKKRRTGYSTGREVFYNKEGVCGEMAYLYVTMARGVSLESGCVYVYKDHRGKKVNHACAGVDTERSYILVDPAYHAFDIKHREWKAKDDDVVIRDMIRWRGG